MTIGEFLTKLEETKSLDWQIGVLCYPDRIRAQNKFSYHCPISAITNNLDDFCQPVEAGMTLGLSEEDATAIKNAADDEGEYPRELRSSILEAVGLSEKTGVAGCPRP
jgi:hypothetical protein